MAKKEQWVEDTQMYQRIAKVPVTTKEELEKEWEEMHKKETSRWPLAESGGMKMPQGRGTALDDKTMDIVWKYYKIAEKNGLVHEWLQWFAGGMKMGLLPGEAAHEACVEWDLL
jgi:hypothetical protein